MVGFVPSWDRRKGPVWYTIVAQERGKNTSVNGVQIGTSTPVNYPDLPVVLTLCQKSKVFCKRIIAANKGD